jgi:hypothetical protein
MIIGRIIEHMYAQLSRIYYCLRQLIYLEARSIALSLRRFQFQNSFGFASILMLIISGDGVISNTRFNTHFTEAHYIADAGNLRERSRRPLSNIRFRD